MDQTSLPAQPLNRANLTRYAWLSVGAALVTIIMKLVAYWVTNSVGLLSDALESIVNLVGALMALTMLAVAARPADENHNYGHSKAEYFSSGVEGTLILIAAVLIGYTAVERLIHPQPLEQVGVGLLVSVGASLVNLAVSLVLRAAGKKHNSISLTANSHHLMTDVITSGGVLVGVGAVALTGWQPLDSLVALLVAANIIWTGVGIIRSTVSGLMDGSLSSEEVCRVEGILAGYQSGEVRTHALRTRQSGSLKIVSLHLLVPGDWPVARGHTLATEIEGRISAELSDCMVFTHLEAMEDPAAMDDPGLQRKGC